MTGGRCHLPPLSSGHLRDTAGMRACLHAHRPANADAAARCAALSVESTKPVGATAKRPESASGLRGVGVAEKSRFYFGPNGGL